MEQQKVETTAYIAFVRRILRALARRVGDADEIELGLMFQIRAEIDGFIEVAIGRQRERKVSWEIIAQAAGVSRQAVTKKWKREWMQ